VSDYIVDIREYDVPYHVRVAIDKSSSIGLNRNDLNNNYLRCKNREMVYGRSQTWRHKSYLQ